MTVREACERCEVLQSANPSSRAKIISYGILRKFHKQEYIFREREEMDRILFLIEGYAAVCRLNHNHDRKIIFVCGPGMLLNEVVLTDLIVSVSCQTMAECTVLSFSRRQILEIMEGDFGFAKAILDSLSIKTRRLYHQLGNTPNMMHLEKRIAAKLWKLGRDFGVEAEGCIRFEFEMSITFLADMAGSKRETVSRIIKKFSKQNLVVYEKNHFSILNLQGLKAIVMSEKEEN